MTLERQRRRGREAVLHHQLFRVQLLSVGYGDLFLVFKGERAAEEEGGEGGVEDFLEQVGQPLLLNGCLGGIPRLDDRQRV